MGARPAKHVLFGLAAFALGACSSDTVSNISLLPKAGSFDSLSLKSAAPTTELRPVTSADFVDPQGHCAGAAAAPGGGVRGGVSLEMTECEVVTRAGPPDNVVVGTNENGERAVTLTYTGGSRPGIYHFASGRLNSIERGAEPPPEPAKSKKPAAKKPSSA